MIVVCGVCSRSWQEGVLLTDNQGVLGELLVEAFWGCRAAVEIEVEGLGGQCEK